jgi:uncharacterized protein DUF1554
MGMRALVLVVVAGCGGGSHTTSPDGSRAANDAPRSGPRRVFVTKSQYPGDLALAATGFAGLAAGDELCRRSAAQLGGTWKAWLSDPTTNAIDRIADVGPWYLVDGTTMVFANKAALAGTPLVAIAINETGAMTNGHVWTGTAAGGTAAAETCTGWTSQSSTVAGAAGASIAMDSQWTLTAAYFCGTDAFALYCFEQ